ncbi:MAG TPA: hypothetical protein VM010_05560, partial [Chitinophagaceae bacterium]|nr:hypothetical protein [Chitinophagaceae bacterium]
MATHFPMEYRLENGTKVLVQQQEGETYHFTLTPKNGQIQSFMYREAEHTKAEWDAMLDFDQLDALREFWLKTED